jgi:hypothetical protein
LRVSTTEGGILLARSCSANRTVAAQVAFEKGKFETRRSL